MNNTKKSGLLNCIREGLVLLIPVLLVGAFSLVIKSFPITAYQNFINNFASGIIYDFFTTIYDATFGLLAVYMTISLALSYSRTEKARILRSNSMIFTAVICFSIFCGVSTSGDFDISYLGTQGVFTALLCSLSASSLYCSIAKKTRNIKKLHTEGVDESFQYMMTSIVPMLIVVLIYSTAYYLMKLIFGVDTLLDLFMKPVSLLFDNMGRSIWSALLFMLLENLLWFFGIHGGDVCESVSQRIFAPAIDINQAAVTAGQVPSEIFSKQFFDVFVLMGGCGTTLCLLAALLIFGRQRGNKKLAKFASFPMIFNINELMVFGLPIVYNPTYLIPFILTPLAVTATSAFAMYTGIVPVASNTVEWTTPIILGGYTATGSAAGALLQIFNLVLGIAIYAPFVRRSEKNNKIYAKQRMNKLVDTLKESEESRIPVELTKLRGEAGLVSRALADELEFDMTVDLPTMRYQPQFENTGRCIGVESLTMWNHPVYGFIYPPLIFKLAEEEGFLLEYEKNVFRAVIRDMDSLLEILGEKAKISINVTGHIIKTDDFEQFLYELIKKYPDYCSHILIEITEQAALSIDEDLIARLTRIREAGFRFGIDDFSMGSTSIKYLQHNIFELLKLDGVLVRDINENTRSREIVASIVRLSRELGIDVLAEFVETKEQKNILEKSGCYMYQGYYYSKAAVLPELAAAIEDAKERTMEREI